jgi:DNA-binding response OmpR family regulator
MAAILVVEDHAPTAQVMRRLLTHARHRVAVARCCGEAREIVRTFTPDVVMSDIVLPDGCGAALMRELRDALRQRVPALRAIAVTGSVNDPASLLVNGFDQVLVKPTDFRTVQAAIHDASQ